MPRCREVMFGSETEAMASCQQCADAQSGIVQAFPTWARVVVPDTESGGYTLLIARWPALLQNSKAVRNVKSKPKS